MYINTNLLRCRNLHLENLTADNRNDPLLTLVKWDSVDENLYLKIYLLNNFSSKFLHEVNTIIRSPFFKEDGQILWVTTFYNVSICNCTKCWTNFNKNMKNMQVRNYTCHQQKQFIYFFYVRLLKMFLLTFRCLQSITVKGPVSHSLQ